MTRERSRAAHACTLARAASIVAILACAACRTTTTSTAPTSGAAIISRASAVRAWELWDGERCLGSIVRYEEAVDASRAFFAVRNAAQQDMGLVDLDGRAWRYRAHEREPEWLGSGTVEQGAARILGGSSSSRLKEIPLQSLARRTIDPGLE